jgi:AcrR family transcriptional regulator
VNDVEEQTSTPARSRGPARSLSLEQIVDVALALVDAEGADALSVRRVAGVLGVRPNTLYTYLAGRAALEQAVVERVLAEADPRLLDGDASQWRARITTYALALRRRLRAHPGVAALVMRAPMDGAAALAVGEGMLGAFADAGLATEDAARATWVVIVQVLGSVALDVADTPDGRPGPERAWVASRRARMRGLDAADWPLTVAATDDVARWVTKAQFAWGLDAVLTGLTSGAQHGALGDSEEQGA